MSSSNLQSFLKCTTPTVPSQSLPKTSGRNLSNKWQLSGDGGGGHAVDHEYYFTLEDLWGCYDEWSAYGAGAPICLENGKTVVQYYTPFLSGMQLYLGKSLRSTGEDSDHLEVETESASSDSSEDGKLSTSNSSDNSSRTWELMEDSSGVEQDGDHYKMKELRFGELYLEHFDVAAPHLRLPLRDQINMLAEEYPGLNSLRSIDLSPASWMAVAWYPIYHIPAQRNPKEFYSAFLTYHTLSSFYQDYNMISNIETVVLDEHTTSNCSTRTSSDHHLRSSEAEVRMKKTSCRSVEEKGTNTMMISLSPFGLASYRMQSHVWMNPCTSSSEEEEEHYQRLASLWGAAASWLMQLDVYDHHSDFAFFSSRSII